jgi:DNA-binding NarL/FixJ family response regulator
MQAAESQKILKTGEKQDYGVLMLFVLIIDDDLLIRQGLRSLLEHEFGAVLCGEARVVEDALGEVAKRNWDLIILDIGHPNDPGRDGLALLPKIRRRRFWAPVLVMSARADSSYARRAQQKGATGYTGKDAGHEALSQAIRDVVAGRRHFDSVRACGPKDLSPRESRVMLALASGKRNLEIAADLKLSIKTVSTYRRRALDKLSLDTTADLVRHVVYHNLAPH